MLLPGLYHPHCYQGAQFCIRVSPGNLDFRGELPLSFFMPSHQRILLLWQTQCYSRSSWNMPAGGFSGFTKCIHCSLPTVPSLGSLPPPSDMTDEKILTSLSQPHGVPAPSPGSLARMLNAILENASPSIHFPYPISHFISLWPAPSPSTPTQNPWLLRGHVGCIPQLLRAIFPFLH